MASYHILMILPERKNNSSSESVAAKIVEYLKSCNALDSDALHYADEDGDNFCFNIVKECQETSNELLKEDKKYHGIVFDIASQCFSEAFFSYTKQNVNKSTALIKLVDGVVSGWEGQSYFLSENDNILQIAKSSEERLIINMIIGFIKKPILNIILSQSFSHQINDVKSVIRDHYLPIITRININIISSIEFESTDNVDLGLLSKKDFFNIFVLEEDSFDDDNYLRLILEAKNNSLIAYWKNIKISDFDKFFAAQENKLEKFSNQDMERLKTIISLKSKINNFHCYLHLGAISILLHMNKVLFDSCKYISFSAGLTPEQAEKRFKEIFESGKQRVNATSTEMRIETLYMQGGQLSLQGSVNN